MTIEKAARILREMYSRAQTGDRALQFHLFGIVYADDLRRLSVRQILYVADLPASYSTEISKGRKLGKYVVVRPDEL